MKQVIAVVVSIFLVATVAIGCDDEPADQTDEAAVDQQADEQLGDDGQVVDDESDDGEVVDDGSPEALEGAQWMVAEMYNVQVQLPEGWEISETDDIVSANDPHGSTTVIIGGADAEHTLQEAIENLKDELQFTDVEIDTGEPTTLGGFPAHQGSGSAVLIREDDIDEEIQFLGYALNTGDDEQVLLTIFSEATMYEAKRDIINGIAQTVTQP